MYTIQEEAINKLNAFIQEIPVKYGLPILKLLNENLILAIETQPEEEKTEK